MDVMIRIRIRCVLQHHLIKYVNQYFAFYDVQRQSADITSSRKTCPTFKGRLSRTRSNDPQFFGMTSLTSRGRTSHKTCGLTAIRTSDAIKLSCCNDKLL
jgi:hypothetical protein